MRASKIEEQEAQFASTLTNTSRIKYTKIETQEIAGANIERIRPKFESYYYKEETKKNLIVLHSTAGTLKADMGALTKADEHVCVSYVIARSGTIYELFDPSYWSYHLGANAVGGNKVNSQRSIAIELSNYGPLTKVGDSLETIYSSLTYTDANGVMKKSARDVYCDMDEIEYYTTVEDGYRGYTYFATFTDAQYKALDSLLDYLCGKFNIPREFIAADKRYDVFGSANDAKSFSGIATHVNFRKSGKWDLGPDFNWAKITDEEVEPDDVTVTPEQIFVPVTPEITEPTHEPTPEEIIPTVPTVPVSKADKKIPWWLALISKLFRK